MWLEEELVWVLECKLSDTPEAREQLRGLYFPVLEHVFRRPARGITVCKSVNQYSMSQIIVASLDEAKRIAASGEHIPSLHWLGKTRRL
jgi:hypothetical protein